MQVCTSLQTDNHASTPPLSFLKVGCHSCLPSWLHLKLLTELRLNCFCNTLCTDFIHTFTVVISNNLFTHLSKIFPLYLNYAVTLPGKSNNRRITSSLTNLTRQSDNIVNMWWKCFNGFMQCISTNHPSRQHRKNENGFALYFSE